MKFLLALSTLFMTVVLAIAYPFGPFNSFNSFSGDFGGPSAFDSNAFQSAALVQDNRSNRGPVTFPMPPTDGPMESSGVVIGASGFGFVPPQGSGASFTQFGQRRYF